MKPADEARRELVRQWVLKAEKDFGLAEHLVREGSLYPEAVGFNSQQAAEKFLKAFLVMHQIHFPKTHNLGELLDLVAAIDRALAESLREATALNPYGVLYRYPGEFPELTKEAATTALELAAKVRAAVAPLLSAYLQPPCQQS